MFSLSGKILPNSLFSLCRGNPESDNYLHVVLKRSKVPVKKRLALMINSLNAYSGYFHSQVDGDVGFDTRAHRVTSDHVHFRRRQEPETTLHVVRNLPNRHFYIGFLNPILVRQLQKRRQHLEQQFDANK